MFKFCPRCGKELPDIRPKYCPECGSILDENIKINENIDNKTHEKINKSIPTEDGILFFTDERILYANISGTGDRIAHTFGAGGIFDIASRAKEYAKQGQLKEMTIEEILNDNEKNFYIKYNEIKRIEIWKSPLLIASEPIFDIRIEKNQMKYIFTVDNYDLDKAVSYLTSLFNNVKVRKFVTTQEYENKW